MRARKMEIEGANGELPADCNVAQSGAIQLHVKEEHKNDRELGAVKNKSVTTGARTGCLQPSLHIGYISSQLRSQNTRKLCSASGTLKNVCQPITILQTH